MKTCKSCHHWSPWLKSSYRGTSVVETYGCCRIFDGDNTGPAICRSKAFASSPEGDGTAGLNTAADFGCNLWKEK